jgi:hypothetical protein
MLARRFFPDPRLRVEDARITLMRDCGTGPPDSIVSSTLKPSNETHFIKNFPEYPEPPVPKCGWEVHERRGPIEGCGSAGP